MSVYMRFYVKTKNLRQVERVIIATLGGRAWLEENERGELLHPLTILRENQHTIQPARDVFRNLVDMSPKPDRPKRNCWSGFSNLWKRPPCKEQPTEAESDIAKWYWLPSIIRFQSVEAARVARALYESADVETVAEDNEISGDGDDAEATVIESGHYLIQTTPAG